MWFTESLNKQQDGRRIFREASAGLRNTQRKLSKKEKAFAETRKETNKT
jgi:hypothetical protein